MTEQNNTLQSSDEIDLIELIIGIWQKKWWVILFTVVFAVLSVLFSLTAKEQWTSKAEVIAPRNYEIENIMRDKLTYAQITDGEVGNLSGSLYSSFMTELRSVKSRTDFFKQSSVYKKLTEGMDESKKQAVLRGLASQSISIAWPDKKKEIDYPTISLSMNNPEDAQVALQEYLQYLNIQVFKLYQKGFSVNLNNKIANLEFDIQRIEERLPLNREISMESRLKNLQKALATAKAAGIKEYAKTNDEVVLSEKPTVVQSQEKVVTDNDNIVLMPGEQSLQAQISTRFSRVDEWFLLGEKYLQAQIDNLDKTPLVFPASYHYQKTQLQQLKDLRQSPKNYVTDQAFHYQSAPYLPLKRDKPKRALIVLIGTFAGGVLGVLVALFMSALESRKRRLA